MGQSQILIVDDDTDIREVIQMALNLDGYAVGQAKNGQEALAQVRARPPDVILLDLAMPVMDGREFRAVQRADPAIAGIPVVVISGEPNGREEAAFMGVAGYLRKPLDVGALLLLLARCLAPAPKQAALQT